MTEIDIPWGPTGEAVYDRTYSRVKANGDRETWPETVERVATGNLALVYGHPDTWSETVRREFEDLACAMIRFEILPAGRHLWASGVKGRQYLFNCHVAGWDSLQAHVEFVLMRLAEGGGVGANYSTKYLEHFGSPWTEVDAHIVCDQSHPDYVKLAEAGLLSDQYDANWPGAFEVEDTREGWAAAIIDLIDAAYNPDTAHRARVFDVSRVRWEGARLKTMGGVASGPAPLARALVQIGRVLTSAKVRVGHTFGRRWEQRGQAVWSDKYVDFTKHPLTPIEAMQIDHEIAQAIVAGGTRRSARMSIVRWDDPHVMDFIACKAGDGHWSTNISVEIDDEFIRLLNRNPDGTVTNPQRGDAWSDECAQEHADKVFRGIVKGMLTNGEPGIWNSSLANEGEPNPVQATNPCGEICLEPWENCNLGHVNMDAFVDETGVDMDGLERAHRLITRFLMRATYGDVVDDKQAAVLARNRRIGVGHFGVQGYLAKQGVKFSDISRRARIVRETDSGFMVNPDLGADLRHLAFVVDKAAEVYAHELRIPVPVKKRTIAPTGTIAKMPGRTEGIHPVYARRFIRRVRYSTVDPEQVRQVEELKRAGHEVERAVAEPNTVIVSFLTEDQLVSEVRDMGLPVELVESADEISISDMLKFQTLYQKHWADNAVSFTINVPATKDQAYMMELGYQCPEPDEKRVQEVADTLAPFLSELKGTTMMVDGSRPQAPYERLTDERWQQLTAAGMEVLTDASYDEDCASGACPVK